MKSFDEKSRESYNQKADNFDNTPEGKFTVRFKQLLLEEVKVNSRDNVVDVACGNGTFINMLSGRYDIGGYGADISEQMIANAKSKYPNMTFEVAGCERIPFQNEMFNIMTVCAAYHHFPDVVAFAKEAQRLLKPNGRLYIAEIYYPAIIRILCNPFVRFSKAGDVKFYSPKEITENFAAFGFKQESVKIEGHIQVISLQKQ